MSAQMLAQAASVSGTVSDLAPGASDGMRMLEARAAEAAALERAAVTQAAAGGQIFFLVDFTVNNLIIAYYIAYIKSIRSCWLNIKEILLKIVFFFLHQ